MASGAVSAPTSALGCALAALRRPGAAAYVLLALGLLLTVLGWRFAVSEVTTQAEQDLRERAAETARAIDQHLRAHADALHRLRGAFEGTGWVSRADFARTVQSSVLGDARNGFAGVYFARHLSAGERDPFLASMRADAVLGGGGMANFAIRPSGDRADYLVVEYLEPAEPREGPLGLDLLADPSSRAAVEQARDQGQVRATAPVRRADTPDVWRFALFVPVYRQGAPRQTPQQRRQALAGMVGAEIQVADLLAPVLSGDAHKHLRIVVSDVGPLSGETAPAGAVRMFETTAASGTALGPSAEEATLDVGGRRWSVRLQARATPATFAQVALPWAVLAGGAAVSLLLFGLTWSLTRSRDSAAALASRMTEGLRESEAHARTVTEMLPIPLVRVRVEDGRIVTINRRAAELFRAPAEVAAGMPVHEFCESPAECRRLVARVRRDGLVRDYEMRLKSASGEPVWVLLSAESSQYEGEPVLLMAMIDISARKAAEHALATSEGRFRLIAESVTDLITVVDAEGRRTYANPAWGLAFGETALAAGADAFTEIHADDRDRVRRLFAETFATGVGHRAQYRLCLADGAVRHIESQGNPIRDPDGKVARLVVISRDITEAKLAEEKIHHLAHHDALTGLPNRILLRDRLEQALAHGQRNNRQVGLLFLDLDGFKSVNDSLGHEVGDVLLQTVAERLVKCVRRVDTVARLGGDEFVVVLPSIKGPGDVEQVARKILESVTAPINAGAHALEVTCSVGGTVYPHDGTDVTTLMKNADAAMYRAKELGRNRYQRFVARVETDNETVAVARLRS